MHPIKDPVEGTAYVVGCSANDPEDMRGPCRMQLVVRAPGMKAFSLDQWFEVWAGQWPQAGDTLPVTFDREKPERIRIDWDRIPTGAEQAQAAAQQLVEQLNAPSGQATGDTADQLSRLAALHEQGQLTDAEFAEAKQKLLQTG